LCRKFGLEHGKLYWRTIISAQGKAWLNLADESSDPGDDLYRGTLNNLRVPAMFIHGRKDPRTEPGELEAVRRNVEKCNMHILNAYHSPHSEITTADQTSQIAREFLEAVS
jgi:pimeloyl-ACP methyl ester carboxylesterase